MSQPRSKSTVIPLVLAFITAALPTVFVIAIQRNAAETDYQSAFLRTVPFVFFGFVATVILVHIAAARVRLGWLIPSLVSVMIVLTFGLVRFEGLSGEMVPQFSWRFARPSAPAPQDSVLVGNGPAEPHGVETDVASAGFLGNGRDGSFDAILQVPGSAEQIKKIWEVGVGAGWSGFAVTDGLAITLEQRGQEEWVTAYGLATGDLVWKHCYPAYHYHPLGGVGPRSTPQVDGDHVYVQGAAGDLHCLNAAKGEVVWHVNVIELAGWTQAESEKSITWGRAGSPLILGEFCYVPLGAADESEFSDRRSLAAFDKLSGDLLWSTGKHQISYASVQVVEVSTNTGLDSAPVQQLVIVNQDYITGHNLDDGAVVWETDWFGRSNAGANCASVIPAGDSRFLVGKGYGGGSGFFEIVDRADGFLLNKLWTSSRTMKTKFNHAVIDGDVAYGISNGALEAIELATGERLWIQPRRDRCGQGHVIRAGRVLVVQGEAGDVRFVEASDEEYRRLLTLPALVGKTWNPPALAGEYLLVRNAESAICFQLPR